MNLTIIAVLLQAALAAPLRAGLSAMASVKDTASTAVVQHIVGAGASTGRRSPQINLT